MIYRQVHEPLIIQRQIETVFHHPRAVAVMIHIHIIFQEVPPCSLLWSGKEKDCQYVSGRPRTLEGVHFPVFSLVYF